MEVSEQKIVRGTAPDTAFFGYGDGDGDGDGYGYGSGDGDGYGYGSGSGDGDGSGSGDGDGYGSGYGYGYGSGSGDGYGDGYGDGDGSGDGDGYGDGYGSKEYWLATVDAFASKWPDTLRSRLAALRREGATIAFWRSDAAGQPANDGCPLEQAAPGVVHTAPGPLALCRAGTLHATFLPPKWKGERWWIVAMLGEIASDGDKVGALQREIIGEAL